MAETHTTVPGAIATVLEGDDVYCSRCDCFTVIDSYPLAVPDGEPVLVECDFCRQLLEVVDQL